MGFSKEGAHEESAKKCSISKPVIPLKKMLFMMINIHKNKIPASCNSNFDFFHDFAPDRSPGSVSV